MTTSDTDFSAASPALGYLYQVRIALLWSLRRLQIDPAFLVSIETLDDVTFESTGGNPTDLLQTKHHRKAEGSLADSSTDIWKTLRIWLDAKKNRVIEKNTQLYLITTTEVQSDSAASYLGLSERQEKLAFRLLDSIAKTSTNKTNAKAYEAFKSAAQEDVIGLLENTYILSASTAIQGLDHELFKALSYATERKKQQPFLKRLEGWWYQRVLQQLINSPQDRIGGIEIETEIDDLREQFKRDSLPVDQDLVQLNLDESIQQLHETYTFVRQLELAKAGSGRIKSAIRDYYKAYEQRSRWLREDLAVGVDLHQYEIRLQEEWSYVFDAILDELGEEATEQM